MAEVLDKGPPPKRKPMEPREARLVAEWVAREFPGDRLLFHQHLGPLPPEARRITLTPEERRFVGVVRRFADAVVVRPFEVVIVEGVIRPRPGKAETLMLYKKLLPLTEELQSVAHLPVRMILLSVIDDHFLRQVSEAFGVEWRVYAPLWAIDYLASLEPRKGVPTRSPF